MAVTAVARKLALRLYRMLRDQIDYDEFRRRGRDVRCARKATSPIERQRDKLHDFRSLGVPTRVQVFENGDVSALATFC